MSTAGSSMESPTAGGNHISGSYPSISATMTIPQKATKASSGAPMFTTTNVQKTLRLKFTSGTY